MPESKSNNESFMSETKYKELAEDEDDLETLSSRDDFPIPIRNRKNYLAASLSIILVIAGIVSIVLLLHPKASTPTTSSKPTPSPNCGRTAAEARARGCIYEPMQRSWIPSECYFPEPSTEYHPFDDRDWFTDADLTQPATAAQLDMLRNGDDFIAYTKYFHHEHCLYCWRKMAIAVDNHLPMIDTKTADLHHTTHCASIIAKMIVEAETYTFNNTGSHTFSPLMFQTCVALDWKQ